jgi:50S ribosomal protein L16 3-hydroxylase
VLLASLGKLLTETKPSLVNLGDEHFSEEPRPAQLAEQFQNGQVLQRNPYLRFAWAQQGAGGHVFMAGENYQIEDCQKHSLITLAEQTEINQTDWQQLKKDSQAVDLLCHLIAEGGWFWQTTG